MYHWKKVCRIILSHLFLTGLTFFDRLWWNRSTSSSCNCHYSTTIIYGDCILLLPSNGDIRRRSFGHYGRIRTPFIVCLGSTSCFTDWSWEVLTVPVTFVPFRFFDRTVLLVFLCTVDFTPTPSYTSPTTFYFSNNSFLIPLVHFTPEINYYYTITFYERSCLRTCIPIACFSWSRDESHSPGTFLDHLREH